MYVVLTGVLGWQVQVAQSHLLGIMEVLFHWEKGWYWKTLELIQS